LAAFPSHAQNAPLRKICSASHAKLDNPTAIFINLVVQRLLPGLIIAYYGIKHFCRNMQNIFFLIIQLSYMNKLLLAYQFVRGCHTAMIFADIISGSVINGVIIADIISHFKQFYFIFF